MDIYIPRECQILIYNIAQINLIRRNYEEHSTKCIHDDNDILHVLFDYSLVTSFFGYLCIIERMNRMYVRGYWSANIERITIEVLIFATMDYGLMTYWIGTMGYEF